MAKFFAVTIVVIAIASAIPIVMHTWPLPQDISIHGHLIDEQFVGHDGRGRNFVPRLANSPGFFI